MIKRFFLFEISETFRGPRFVIVFLLSTILIVASVFTGYLKYDEAVRWHSKALVANKTALQNQGNWGAMQQLGSKAIRKPGKLSILIRGVDGAVGKSAYATPSAQMVLRDSRDELNPVYALLKELDLAFIIKVVLSLFAMLFSFNAITGERENGTLKMILSNPVHRFSIILGKLAGNSVVLFLTLTIPTLVALLFVEISFGVSFSMEEWLRIAFILLAGVLYLILFYLTGLFVSTITRRSVVSFTVCLFVWVMLVTIIPKVCMDISRSFNEVTTLEDAERQLAEIRQQYWQNEMQLLEEYVKEELIRQMNQKYDYRKVDEQADRAQREAIADYRQKEEALVEKFERQLHRRTEAGSVLANFSPASAFNQAVMNLADTDAALRFRFLRQLQEYRNKFQKYVSAKIEEEKGFMPTYVSYDLNLWRDKKTGETRYKVKTYGPTEKLAISDAPVFSFYQQDFLESLDKVLPTIGILMIEILVTMTLSILIFNWYDPR